MLHYIPELQKLTMLLTSDTCNSLFLFFKFRVAKSKDKDKDKLMLFRGQFTISLDRARKGTYYKYVVVKKGKIHWEYLPEFPPLQYYGSIVDRYLKIPDKHTEPGGE